MRDERRRNGLERDPVVDAAALRDAQREHVLAWPAVKPIADEVVAAARTGYQPALAIERELRGVQPIAIADPFRADALRARGVKRVAARLGAGNPAAASSSSVIMNKPANPL